MISELVFVDCSVIDSLTGISGRSDTDVISLCIACCTCMLVLFLGRSVGTETILKAESLTDPAQHRQGCGRLEASSGLLGGVLV